MKRALILIALLALVAPALLFAQGDVTIEGLNDKVHALATDLVILAKELRRLDDRVTALEADRSIPAGEFCVVSANTGMDGSTGFQLRPETIDRYLNRFGELPEGIKACRTQESFLKAGCWRCATLCWTRCMTLRSSRGGTTVNSEAWS